MKKYYIDYLKAVAVSLDNVLSIRRKTCFIASTGKVKYQIEILYTNGMTNDINCVNERELDNTFCDIMKKLTEK